MHASIAGNTDLIHLFNPLRPKGNDLKRLTESQAINFINSLIEICQVYLTFIALLVYLLNSYANV